MDRNFSIGQANELVLDGQLFDLHNCYDFSGIVVMSTGRAQLWFRPNPEHTKNVNALVVDVLGVDVLEITQGVLLGTVCDLDEVGFKNPGDTDLDWLVGERHARGNDHLVFSFGPDEHVRVHGERAQLREERKSLIRLLEPSTPDEIPFRKE